MVWRVGKKSAFAVDHGPYEVRARARDGWHPDETGFQILDAALRLGERIVSLEWREVDVNLGENGGEALPWLYRELLDAIGETSEPIVEVE